MEENVQTYYPLGQKTFFMLVFNKSFLSLFLLVLLIVILVLFSYVPSHYISIAMYGIFGYLGFFLVVLLLTFTVGWLEYIHYGIFIDEKNLKIKKGLISEEMTGIPYRRIKDVRIERSLINQIFGVSNIIITMLGEEDKGESQEEEEEEYTMFLPVLEKDVALHIQDTVLKKAQVEQIDVLSGHDNMLKK